MRLQLNILATPDKMSDAERNKIAAQIIKADMLGDREKAASLKRQLEDLTKPSNLVVPRREPYVNRPAPTSQLDSRPTYSQMKHMNRGRDPAPIQDNRVKKFLSSTGSLRQMFEAEKRVSASSEVKMYLNTAAKFSRDDMETKHFSEEVDNSQMVLNKNKRHKPETADSSKRHQQPRDDVPCGKCPDRISRHLIIDSTDDIYMSATETKPFLSHMSNVIISNRAHTCNAFVSAEHRQQSDAETMIVRLRDKWKSKGYRCIIMETFFRDRRPSRGELTSCGNHFQVHCLPIKEKHFERSRMSFKQALQDCEQEWSMNKKLIITDGRKIQRYLPKGLSYFWVCFDELSNGFGHVIEQEVNFSRHFGLEVLAGMLDKDFNPMRLDQREEYDEQFKRCRDLKLLYSDCKPDQL